MSIEEPELTLSEYWRIIRKRYKTILFVFFTVVISTFIFTKFQTPIYEASVEVKIEKQQPILALGSDKQLAVSQGVSNLDTEMLLIDSLPVMRKVVERIEVLPSNPDEREKSVHALSLSYQQNITVSQIGKTDIVRITATSNNPEKVVLMANAVADVYVVENVEGRKKQSKAIIKYLDEQIKDYQKRIADEEAALQKFNQNEKVFAVTPEVKATLDRLTIAGTFEFETKMLDIDKELTELNKYLSENNAQTVLNKINDQGILQNFIFMGLKRRLLELEFERFLLLIDYTENHPTVLAKDKIIDEVKVKIVEMLKSFSKVPMTPEIESELSLIIKKLFLENRREVLYRIVNRFYEDSGSLSSNQLKYVGLKRNLEELLTSYETLIKQRDESQLNLAKVIDDVVTVVSTPSKPHNPVKPKMSLNLTVSAVVGFLLGIVVCFIKESVDSSISTISDVEHELKLSILGVIPHMRKEDVLIGKEEDYDTKDLKLLYQKLRLVTIMSPKSWPAESLKMFRTNLSQIMKTKGHKAILFTSSDKQEGKSTIVTNTALSMAQFGKKTVLVESNMRRPTSYKIFGLEREPGLSDILMGNVTWQEAINNSTDILAGGLDVDKLLGIPGIDNLKMITCGRPVDNISELINSAAYDQLLKELKQNFDVIIIDCSPVMAVPDAITLCDKVDGVVLVYKVGHTPKDVLSRAKANLINAGANILGIILNDIKTEAQVGYSAYYYRYYAETPEDNSGLIKKFKMREKNSKNGQTTKV